MSILRGSMVNITVFGKKKMRNNPRLVGVAWGFSVFVGLEQAHEDKKLCFRGIFYMHIKKFMSSPLFNSKVEVFIVVYESWFKGSSKIVIIPPWPWSSWTTYFLRIVVINASYEVDNIHITINVFSMGESLVGVGESCLTNTPLGELQRDSPHVSPSMPFTNLPHITTTGQPCLLYILLWLLEIIFKLFLSFNKFTKSDI